MMRPATVDDLPAIIAMLADDALGSAREDWSVPPAAAYVEAFGAVDADPNQCLAVAVKDEQVVGCLQITFVPGLSRLGMWRGQIESVRIHADFRGSGLGREMLLWAIEQCRARRCGLVQLATDKSRSEALRFYESLGFEASHEGMKLGL